jgi:hypothetical protein
VSSGPRAGRCDLTPADSADDLGGDPVLQHQQRTQPLQQRRTGQQVQVLGGQGVDRGLQLTHPDTSSTRFEQVYEV